MYSDDDLKALHSFLKRTAEGNLQKMMVGGKMTEHHIKAILKVARNVSDEDWCVHWNAGTFPKVKFAPAETALKETLYAVCGDAAAKVGLVTAMKKVA